MKITDLIQEFEITYDLGGLGLPGFEEDERKELLELSQYRIINQRLQGNNVYNSKYPDTIKRIDDLQGLVSVASKKSGETGEPSDFNWSVQGDYVIITLPSTYLHLIPDGMFISGANVEIAKEISINEAIRFNSSRKNLLPYIRIPVFHFIDSTISVNSPNSTVNRKIKLFVDSDFGVNSITDIKCNYIRKPINLTEVGSDNLYDFNDDVYHEIVAGAVDHAITIASPNKAQVSQQSLNKIE